MSENNENSRKDNKLTYSRRKYQRNSNEDIQKEKEIEEDKNKEKKIYENEQKNPESQKPNNIYNSYISPKPTKLNYYSDIQNNENENNIEKKGTNNSLALSVNNLSNTNDKLSISISGSNYQFDKEFLSPVLVKKENILLTDSHYVTFENRYGENSCYFNVILRLLCDFDEICDFLLDLYEIDESMKKIGEKNNNESQNQHFLVLLGKIIHDYDDILNDNNNDKQINMIKTSKIRKYLEQISNEKFPLNNIADPVELLTFIFDILNDFMSEGLHKKFYLDLTEEFYCNQCQSKIKNEYDKDNFIYHIYIDEILNHIDSANIKINEYKNNFFELAQKIYKKDIKQCEKCQKIMKKNLICNNKPSYLLINCVWKVSNPILDDVVKFLFLLSLRDDLDNLFSCKIKRGMDYYLSAIVLYSFTLSHYIIVMYKNKVFVLFDDENVKEFNDLNDLIIEITVNILKKNGRAFFYPVMLIYTNETIYDYKMLRFNKLNNSSYYDIIKRSNEAIYEYNEKNNLNEEQKISNYQDYINKQKSFDNKKNNKKNNIAKKDPEIIEIKDDDERENKRKPIKNKNDEIEIENLKADLKEKSKPKSKIKNIENSNDNKMEIEENLENTNFSKRNRNKRNSQIKEEQKELSNQEEQYNQKYRTQRTKKNHEIKEDDDIMNIEENPSKTNNFKTKNRNLSNMEIEYEDEKDEKKEMNIKQTTKNKYTIQKLKEINQDIKNLRRNKKDISNEKTNYNNINDNDSKYMGTKSRFKENIYEDYNYDENKEKENKSKTYKKKYETKNNYDNDNINQQKSSGKKLYNDFKKNEDNENRTAGRKEKNFVAKSTIQGGNNEYNRSYRRNYK